MIAAAEQLAENFDFSRMATAGEPKRRIWFTFGVLLAYRLGSYVPLPGIDQAARAELFRPK